MVFKALDPDWIRIGIQPKMLDPDPDEMNADPHPAFTRLELNSVNKIFRKLGYPSSWVFSILSLNIMNPEEKKIVVSNPASDFLVQNPIKIFFFY